MLNDVYLNLEFRKSINEKTDENGNYIFEVEASNENVDLQDQIVLQHALIDSKDNFLKNGVISFDHLHKKHLPDGSTESDPSMVIGEPIDVKFDPDTKSTVVVGKLYKHNKKAKDLIKLLKDGSTRVRASVGGIFPKIVKDERTGIEKITSVFWNDLALTVTPVNATVGSAVFAKSYSPAEFVKALQAGYGADSASYDGGRVLIKEDLGTLTENADREKIRKSERDEDSEELKITDEEARILNEFRERTEKGEFLEYSSKVEFLKQNGIKTERAEILIKEIEREEEKMAKSFKKTIKSLCKSVGFEDELKKAKDEELENEEEKESLEDSSANEPFENEGEDEYEEENVDDDEDRDEDEDENGDEDDDENGDEDDDENVSGDVVLKSLDFNLTEIKKSIKGLRRDLNDSMELLSVVVKKSQAGKLPARSVLSKSLKEKDSETPDRPTQEDFYKAREILSKAVNEGRLTLVKSSMISSDIQRAMRTGQPMKKEHFDFLQKEFSKSN